MHQRRSALCCNDGGSPFPIAAALTGAEEKKEETVAGWEWLARVSPAGTQFKSKRLRCRKMASNSSKPAVSSVAVTRVSIQRLDPAVERISPPHLH